jgi:hypothetical protein
MFAKKMFKALKSCPNPSLLSHSSLPQSLPHVVPLVPPEHCFAAPSAEVRKTKSIRSWKLAAGSRGVVELKLSTVVLRGIEENMPSGVRARVWAKARARIARKAIWSVLQFLPGAQAISVRVPFGAASLPEAKIFWMARKEGM